MLLLVVIRETEACCGSLLELAGLWGRPRVMPCSYLNCQSDFLFGTLLNCQLDFLFGTQKGKGRKKGKQGSDLDAHRNGRRAWTSAWWGWRGARLRRPGRGIRARRPSAAGRARRRRLRRPRGSPPVRGRTGMAPPGGASAAGWVRPFPRRRRSPPPPWPRSGAVGGSGGGGVGLVWAVTFSFPFHHVAHCFWRRHFAATFDWQFCLTKRYRLICTSLTVV